MHNKLSIEIYADGSDLKEMVALYNNNLIAGFTTNPSLMRKAGVTDYVEFVKSVMRTIRTVPVSFEVFEDDLVGMERQARILAGFGDNIFVKIPIINTKGESTSYMIGKLLKDGIKVNVTAVFTIQQIDSLIPYIDSRSDLIISIFAGRIADTGVNPNAVVEYALESVCSFRNVRVLWASCREVYNIYEADKIGCHIITVTSDIIKKFCEFSNKDLDEYSLETVKMFYNDAQKSGYVL